MDGKIKIIYIKSDSHSGSTLLDIVIGCSDSRFFNGGELTHSCRSSILNEYCSCGAKIKDCKFWGLIYPEWKRKMTCNFSEYYNLKKRYENLKSFPRLIYNLVLPSNKFRKYVNDTKIFFSIISSHSGNEYIIDSSKSPGRALILNQFAKVKCIHLIRSFTGVLNSANKSIEENIKAGVEKPVIKKKTSKVLRTWIFTNLFCEITSLFIASKKISFHKFIKSPSVISNLYGFIKDDIQYKNLSAPHMLAGNRLRLKSNISIRPEFSDIKSNISRTKLKFAAVIDNIFFFWN